MFYDLAEGESPETCIAGMECPSCQKHALPLEQTVTGRRRENLLVKELRHQC